MVKLVLDGGEIRKYVRMIVFEIINNEGARPVVNKL